MYIWNSPIFFKRFLFIYLFIYIFSWTKGLLCLWFQPLQPPSSPPPPPPTTLKTCTNFGRGIGEHVTNCVFPFHCSSHGILKTWQHDPQENLILENLILVAYYKTKLVVVMVVVGTHTERLTSRLLVERVQKRASSHAIYSSKRGGSTP